MPEKTLLSSEEAKAKLLAGEKLENVRIEKLTMSKHVFEQPIEMIECEIDTLDVNKAEFRESVTMRRNKIGMLVISEATFRQKADFKRNDIRRIRCQRGQFEGDTIFGESSFGAVSFHQSTFAGKADFRRTIYREEPAFTEIRFQADALFVNAQFQSKARFSGTHCTGKFDLRSVEVGADLDMREIHCQGDLFFNSAQIARSLDLTGARLHGKTDFNRAQVSQNLIFFGVTPGGSLGFRFGSLGAGRIHIDRPTAEDHVYHEQEGRHDLAAGEYGFLWGVFRQNNLFDDEDWAYYQFKRCERRGRPFSFNPLKMGLRLADYLFLDLGCGYGTRPFRTLGVCLLMMIFFATIYFWTIPFPPGTSYGVGFEIGNRIVYAFDMSLTAFSGSFVDVPGTGPVRFAVMLEFLLGVVFLGLFVVAFSRKVIR